MNSLLRSLVMDVFEERRVRLMSDDAEETDRIATKVSSGNETSNGLIYFVVVRLENRIEWK